MSENEERGLSAASRAGGNLLCALSRQRCATDASDATTRMCNEGALQAQTHGELNHNSKSYKQLNHVRKREDL